MMKSSLLYHLESKPEISGLTYIPDFISAQEQDFLLSQINQQRWLTDLKRRVQHYGYKYHYKARAVGTARKSDIISGIKTERTRRVSLTFRNII